MHHRLLRVRHDDQPPRARRCRRRDGRRRLGLACSELAHPPHWARRIQDAPMLDDFLDLFAIERLEFEQRLRDDLQLVAMVGERVLGLV